MRSVRCDACGVKALIAASKCPKCGHLFEMRDGFGEMLPLAYCSSCDSYYPEHLGSCRWCGTKPERAPIAPYVWKGFGILAFASIALVAWFARDGGRSSTADGRIESSIAQDPPPVIPADTVASRPSAVPADTAVPVAPVVADTSAQTTAASAPTVAVSADTATPNAGASVVPSGAAVETAVPRAAPPRVATTKASGKTPDKATTKPSAAKSKVASRWVSSVSRRWVVIRADASKEARIIASIGPNSRVQLGESRGPWRRIRAKGLAGWVEHRAFFVARTSRKSGGLAAR